MNNGNLLFDINERFTSLTQRRARPFVQIASCSILSMEPSAGYKIKEKHERYVPSEREIIIRHLLFNYNGKSCVIIGFMVFP